MMAFESLGFYVLGAKINWSYNLWGDDVFILNQISYSCPYGIFFTTEYLTKLLK